MNVLRRTAASLATCDTGPFEPLESRVLLSGGLAGERGFSHVMYYPEGFAGSSISEFLPLGNFNDAPADYRVLVHFESALPDLVVAEGTLRANSRGGVTLSRAADHLADLVPMGEAYSLEVQSTLPLAATLSHYDFGSATGEAFTDTPSTQWAFPLLARGPGLHDFLVWHNASTREAHISVRFIGADGASLTTVSTVTRAGGRGGMNLSLIDGLPADEVFAAIVTSDEPIVGAASRYDTNDQTRGASTGLGTPGEGSTAGVMPLGELAGNAVDELVFLDLGAPIFRGLSARTVTLIFNSTDAETDPIVRTIDLIPFGITRFDVSSLHDVLGNGAYSVQFQSPVLLAARAHHRAHGDDADSPMTQAAGTRTLFAEGFMNPDRAGLDVFETIGVSTPAGVSPPAPASSSSLVTVTIRFVNGAEPFVGHFGLDAHGAFTLNTHEWSPLLAEVRRRGEYFYSIQIDTGVPTVGAMWHFDTTLGAQTPAGGFAAGGQPTTNPPIPGVATFDLQTGFALGHGGTPSRLGNILHVAAGNSGPQRIEITLQGGIYQFLSNGQTPAVNGGLQRLRDNLALAGSGASLSLPPYERRPRPYDSGGGDGVEQRDGLGINDIDATATYVWSEWFEWPPPPPPTPGANAMTSAYRFYVDITDGSTPRDIVVTFAGVGAAAVGWNVVQQLPPQHGFPGSVTWSTIPSADVRFATLALTIRIG